MPYVAPTTHVAGETLPAADYNVIVNDVISFRNKSGIVPPAVRLTNSASITGYTSNTVITWNTEEFDTDTMHSTSTNTDRITIVTPGIYLFSAVIFLSFTGTSTRSEAYIQKNNSINSAPADLQLDGSAATNRVITLTGISNCAANDYFSCLWSETGGSSLIVNSNRSYFSAVMLGATT